MGEKYLIDVTIKTTIETEADDYKHAYSVCENDVQDALKAIGAKDLDVSITTVIEKRRTA